MLSTCRHTAALTIFPVGTWETDSRGGYSLGIQKLQRIFPMFKFAIRDTICCAWRWHSHSLYLWVRGACCPTFHISPCGGCLFTMWRQGRRKVGGGGLGYRNPPELICGRGGGGEVVHICYYVRVISIMGGWPP